MLQSACRAANWFSSSSAAVRTWWRVVDRKARESAGVTVRSRFSKAALIVCRASADTAGVSGIVSVFTHFVLSRSTVLWARSLFMGICLQGCRSQLEIRAPVTG